MKKYVKFLSFCLAVVFVLYSGPLFGLVGITLPSQNITADAYSVAKNELEDDESSERALPPVENNDPRSHSSKPDIVDNDSRKDNDSNSDNEGTSITRQVIIVEVSDFSEGDGLVEGPFSTTIIEIILYIIRIIGGKGKIGK